MKSTVEVNAAIVNGLVEFGREVASSYAAEQPEIKDYVLDVAYDNHGVPVMIERNSYPNAGFYACQPRLVVEALSN